MSETTTRRPWFQVAAPCGEVFDREVQLARWLTYTHANMLAFDEDPIRAAAYLHRALPAFTAAALTKGWTPEMAYRVCVEGDVGEFTWDWLVELGIDPDSIASAKEPAA